MHTMKLLVLVWLACGIVGVLVIACRRPKRIFRGGIETLSVVLVGIALGAVSLCSALTNRKEDF